MATEQQDARVIRLRNPRPEDRHLVSDPDNLASEAA